MGPQDSSHHTIRILMDKLPNRFPTSSQALDIRLDATGRKIFPLIQSGQYRVSFFDPQANLLLQPAIPGRFEHDTPTLDFILIQDETTRALTFRRGDGDVLYDQLTLVKTHWLLSQTPSSHFFTAKGFRFSFLGFNLTDPVLKKIEVRRAIAQSLPIAEWAHEKWKNWVEPFSNLNIPSFSPQAASSFFKTIPPLELSCLTTPVREGLETSLLIREALKQVAVKVNIQITEPTLFFSRLKHQPTQIFSSRVLRDAENDSIAEYIKTDGEKNYFHYSNSALDQFLVSHPLASLADVLPWIERDLPFVPLYNWNHALILNPRVHATKELELDESFRFLLDLQLR